MRDYLSLLAAAKINLSLHVCGRREDGYHELESLVGFASFGDRLSFEKLPAGHPASLCINGSTDLAATPDNLVWRAHAALQSYIGRALPVAMTLNKTLPLASGLGGGSADAAACLRGLISLFGLSVSPAALAGMAIELGADVSVCLSSVPAWMTGTGAHVQPLTPFPETGLVVVHCGIDMPTEQVFQELRAGPVSEPVSELTQSDPQGFESVDALVAFLGQWGNDLQAVAHRLIPEISASLAALRACGGAFSAMSGSGVSCFALCQQGQTGELATRYRQQRPDDLVLEGRLIGARDTKINELSK